MDYGGTQFSVSRSLDVQRKKRRDILITIGKALKDRQNIVYNKNVMALKTDL